MTRSNNFNILKLLSALLIMTGHSAIIFGAYLPTLYLDGVHSLGVRILFLISGYLITYSFRANDNFLKYFIKRIFRVLPALIMYCLIVVFIIGPIVSDLSFKEYFSNPNTFDYLKNICLYITYSLPGVFTSNIYPGIVNGSLWSLPIEFVLYFIFPIFLIICNSKNNDLKSFIKMATITSLIIIIRFLSYYNYIDLNFLIYNINISAAIELVPWYFIGSLYTYPFIKDKLSIQKSFVFLMLLFVIQQNNIVFYLCRYFVLSYSTFSFALTEKPIFKNVFNKYELSYGIYLYGFFVQQLLVNIFIKLNLGINYLLLSILSIFITCLFALLSNVTIERQTNKLMKNIVNKIK